MSKSLAQRVHEAMQNAPLDNQLYRQARAAIAATKCQELLEMLKGLEWYNDVRYGPTCPTCLHAHGRGHTPDCALARLLRECGEMG